MWKSIYLLILALSFVINCQSQQIVSPQLTQVIFKEQSSGPVAGYPVIAQIQPRDTNNNTITGCVLPALNPFTANSTQGLFIQDPAPCSPNVQFPYVFTLYTEIATSFQVYFWYQGQPVGDSPYTVSFKYGPISANNSYASGSGLDFATVAKNATFNFTTNDQFNNPVMECLPQSQWNQFTILLTQIIPIYGQVDSCDNTTFIYTASYITTSTDPAFLYVQYNGNNFNDMPTKPFIESGTPYGPSCILGSSIKNVTQAGVPGFFTLECTDQYGNLLSDCSYFKASDWVALFNSSETTNSFRTLPPVCLGEGRYNFTFISFVAALYDTNVYYSTPSNAVPTFTTLIEPGPPTNILAQGAGVQYNNPLNIAGVPSFFSIFLADQYNNTLTRCFNSSPGDWHINTKPSMTINAQPPVCLTNTMVSNWTADQVLTVPYTITIGYQNVTSNGNPYFTNVFPNVFDPTKSELQPLTNTSVQAGLPLPFSIKGYDLYGNEITNCSSVTLNQFSVTANEISNKTNQIIGTTPQCTQVTSTEIRLTGSIYGTVIGQYTLIVKYNNTQLRNSPKNFTVLPGPLDASLTYIVGTGFTNQTQIQAGEKYNFYIYQEDQYGNAISDCSRKQEWEVVIQAEGSGNPPDPQYTTGFCQNSTGAIAITFYISTTGSYDITVYAITNNVTSEIPTQGYVEVYPGPFNRQQSKVDVQPEAEIGDQVTVRVTPFDQFGNAILNCTDQVAAILEIYARYNTELVAQGNMSCLSTGNYSGTYLANYTGSFFVDVGENVAGLYLPVGLPGTTNVVFGVFAASYSVASGPGVDYTAGTIVAGTNAMIYISPRNKNGFTVPASNVNPTLFTFDITGASNPVKIQNANVTNTTGADIEIAYMGTIAQNYIVEILYNGSLLGNEPAAPTYYTSTIVASTIDLNTLEATNVISDDSGTGTFDLTATDMYGNPVVVFGLDVALAPACVSPNVTDCGPNDGVFTCTYTVSEAGVYCITVQNPFTQVQYPVVNSTILVTGGSGCLDQGFCNDNGICFQNSDSKYQCNCKNGYTGDNCETKIKSHYMKLWLGVGLLIGLSILLLVIGVVVGCLLGRRNRGAQYV